jgi:hypothetical protein
MHAVTRSRCHALTGPPDPLDGDAQRAELVDGLGEPARLDHRLDPPEPPPHRRARAVQPRRERDHLGAQREPLLPAGRARARLLPGSQRADQRVVVTRRAGLRERGGGELLDPLLLAVVERQVAALGEQPGPQPGRAVVAEPGQRRLAQLRGQRFHRRVGHRLQDEGRLRSELGAVGAAGRLARGVDRAARSPDSDAPGPARRARDTARRGPPGSATASALR